MVLGEFRGDGVIFRPQRIFVAFLAKDIQAGAGPEEIVGIFVLGQPEVFLGIGVILFGIVIVHQPFVDVDHVGPVDAGDTGIGELTIIDGCGVFLLRFLGGDVGVQGRSGIDGELGPALGRHIGAGTDGALKIVQRVIVLARVVIGSTYLEITLVDLVDGFIAIHLQEEKLLVLFIQVDIFLQRDESGVTGIGILGAQLVIGGDGIVDLQFIIPGFCILLMFWIGQRIVDLRLGIGDFTGFQQIFGFVDALCEQAHTNHGKETSQEESSHFLNVYLIYDF